MNCIMNCILVALILVVIAVAIFHPEALDHNDKPWNGEVDSSSTSTVY